MISVESKKIYNIYITNGDHGNYCKDFISMNSFLEQ